MKKGHYLVATAAIAMAFASCKPMDKTYSTLDGAPAAKSITYTVQAIDYTNTSIFASGTAVNKQKGFLTTDDATANIPTLLNFKYYDAANGSTAKITFTPLSKTLVQPDSVYADIKYTLTNKADYLLLPGNNFADFSLAQTLSWLPYKYPTPAANEQHVLTWIFYPTITTTNPQIYPGLYINSTVSGTTTTTNATGSLAYIGGAWIQCYYITPAQYAAVGRGQFNEFTNNDDANIPSFINGILKADASINAAAKTGAMQYVSFYYYNAAKVASQRIMPLVFNGTDWVPTSYTQAYLKSSGKWVPDPTVYYQLIKANTDAMAKDTNIGTATLRTNLGTYGDFASGWTTSDITKGIINDVLPVAFPSPKVNVNYVITYLVYSGGDKPTTATFTYNGTTWSQVQ
jgi:hypothetical protein